MKATNWKSPIAAGFAVVLGCVLSTTALVALTLGAFTVASVCLLGMMVCCLVYSAAVS